MATAVVNERLRQPSIPKCPHGVYDPTGHAEYCSLCTTGGPPEDDDEWETLAFQTCAVCGRTKRIDEFPANAYRSCSECTPHPRVLKPKPRVAGRCGNCDAEIEPPAELCPSCESLQTTAASKIRVESRQARRDLKRIRANQWPKRNPDRKKEHGMRRRDRYGDGDFTLAAWIEKVGTAGWMCVFCERPLTLETAICGRWLPASRGGTNDIENCFPACRPCHGRFAASSRWHARLAA